MTVMAQTLLWVLLISFAVSTPLRADSHETRLYLPAGSVNAEALIGPPPAINSEAFNEQMAVVMWMQLSRTPEQVAFAEKTLNVDRYAPILNDALLGVDGIALKDMIDAAISEVRSDYDALKGVFDLPRPFQLNDQVDPLGDPRPVASYPSGHSIRAVVYARLLAEMFPDHRDDLMALAMQVGYGRVTAGVHYPVDVTAGQKLGNAYADVIVKQPAFEKAMNDIRKK